MGLLGDHNPQALVDTILFYNGLYFVFRSGGEHRQLRREPCQIQVSEPSGEVPYLQDTEDVSKNRPGGIKGSHIPPKVLTDYANVENPSRCFVLSFQIVLESLSMYCSCRRVLPKATG